MRTRSAKKQTNNNRTKKLMKKTATILASLTIGIGSVLAGPAPVVSTASTGKGTPPPPPMDRCAGPISYSNVELSYLNTDVDGNGGSLDGGTLRFEYSLAPNFYMTAGADYSTGDGPDYGMLDYGSLLDGTDLWTVRLGVGGSWALSENFHLVGEVGAMYFDASTELNVVPGPNDTWTGYRSEYGESDWGWYVRPHLRAKFGCFEIHAGAEYQDAYEDNWAFFGNAYYQVAQGWDLTAGYREGDDSTQWSAGVRYRY